MNDDDWNFEGDQMASDDPAFEEILQRSVIDIQLQPQLSTTTAAARSRNHGKFNPTITKRRFKNHSFPLIPNNYLLLLLPVSTTAALALSSNDYNVNRNGINNGRNHTTTNTTTNMTMHMETEQVGLQNWAKKQELKRRIAEIDADIQSLKDSIKSLNTQVGLKQDQKEVMVRMLNELDRLGNGTNAVGMNANANASGSGSGKGKGRVGQSIINYMDGDFEWVGGLKARMRNVFGINEFRLCQRGICNANMDGRDVVVVMPTGGGKSLTYQLPALLTPGCTLVISPLISLITDQILHLQANGIRAVALTSGTPAGEKKDIARQLIALAERRLNPGEDEIKLCYVTPEKLAKDNNFVALLQKLAVAGKLARIVIDEAHCVSQMGHDFRPDYQKLHRLRQLLPSVPIMALSATCPPLVLKDLLKTLRLADIVDGRNAKTIGTVYFFAPLYRKNLHYRIVPKPSKASDVTKVMVDYILENHPNDTGIVYCLSRKNTETVAQELQELSNGRIKTGVYHADKKEAEKSELHSAWRAGRIKVVCATIAFGLGIDKGDVRFVLHHSMSKSLEGYYQESGRAGRDGKDADCVLFYRPQDGSTLASMVAGEKSGQEKLHAILEFAEELEECRKIHFAKYFSHSTNLSISSWTTEDQDALQRCGHCDNCLRPQESIDKNKDVSLYAWQILKIINHVQKTGGKATINMLAGLARNLGGGAFEVVTGGGRGRKGKGKEKEKVCLDLDSVAGGVVDLPRDDIEHLIVKLLIKGYLKEEYQQTSYSTNVHVVPDTLAARFIHETKERIIDTCKTRPMLIMTLAKPAAAKTRGRKKKNDDVEGEGEGNGGDGDGDIPPPTKKRRTTATGTGSGSAKGKKKADVVPVEEADDIDDMYMDDEGADLPEHSAPVTHRPNTKNLKPSIQATQSRSLTQSTLRSSTLVGTSSSKANTNPNPEYEYTELMDLEEIEDDSDDDNILYGWSKSLREKPVVRRRIQQPIVPADKEVLELSD